MIHIRYRDLSAGTHEVTWLYGRAERCARGTTVYLVPGLTTRQRRAALRRLRQEASRGFGPPLPISQLTVALGVDRVRTGARIAGSVVRLHPAVTLLPGALAASLMALFVLASSERAGFGPTGGTLEQSAAVAGGLQEPVPAPPGAPMAQVTEDSQTSFGAMAAVPALGLSGAWYACPQPALSPLQARHGSPGCQRWRSRAVADTAHRPAPSDLAR